jgi:hypothetical protein
MTAQLEALFGKSTHDISMGALHRCKSCFLDKKQLTKNPLFIKRKYSKIYKSLIF